CRRPQRWRDSADSRRYGWCRSCWNRGRGAGQPGRPESRCRHTWHDDSCRWHGHRQSFRRHDYPAGQEAAFGPTDFRVEPARPTRNLGHWPGDPVDQRDAQDREDDRSAASATSERFARWRDLWPRSGEGCLTMPLTSKILSAVTTEPPADAWAGVAAHLRETFFAAFPNTGAENEVVGRDRGLAELDNVLSGSAWDLWPHFEAVVPKASQDILDFWTNTTG